LDYIIDTFERFMDGGRATGGAFDSGAPAAMDR
jgi:hypothetical protein